MADFLVRRDDLHSTRVDDEPAEAPLEAGEARLRVEPARNNQHRRVRLAPEFEIDRWTTESLVQLRIGAAGADAGARFSSVG